MKNVASQIFIFLNSNDFIIFIFIRKFDCFVETFRISTKLNIALIVKFRKKIKFVEIFNEKLLRKENDFKIEMNIQNVKNVFINEKLLTRYFKCDVSHLIKLIFQKN